MWQYGRDSLQQGLRSARRVFSPEAGMSGFLCFIFLKERLTVMKKNALIFVVLITGLALGLAPAALAAG